MCVPLVSMCSTPVPAGLMNLTVQNLSRDQITVTQVVGTGATPLCFTVAAQGSECRATDINSVWQITNSESGKVLKTSIAPQQPSATVVVDDYQPARVLDGTGAGVADKLFWGAAAGFLVLGMISSAAMKSQWRPDAAYTECLAVSGPTVCETLHPQKRSYKTFFRLGLLASLLVLLAWAIFKGPLGRILAGEPKSTVTAQQCWARGEGWVFTEPSENDGVKGFKLWLRKMRCRFGQKAGPCMCFNAQDRYTCEVTAFDPLAPSGLQWQPDLANTHLKESKPSDSPAPPPGPFSLVCACCTDKLGGTCVDVRAAHPAVTACSPFPPK